MTVPGRGRDRNNLPNSFSSSHLNLGRVLSHGTAPTQSPPPTGAGHGHSSSFSASTTNLTSATGSGGGRESRPGFFRSAGSHFTNRVRKMSQSTSPAAGASASNSGPIPAISPPPASFRSNRQRPITTSAAAAPRSQQSSREGSHPSHGSSDQASRPAPQQDPVAPGASAAGGNTTGTPPSTSTPTGESADTHPAHRIRLVPHISNGRSVVFEAIERDVREGAAPIKFGRFTDRSGGNSEAVDGRSNPASGPGARGGAIPNINGGRGRIDQNRVAFRSKVVSRSHAELWCESGGRFYIRDTKSSSGTFLNHIRLSGPGVESIPFAIKDGDVIQLGVDYQSGSEESYRSVKMRVELNRGWQRRPNEFNTNALRQLRTLQGEPQPGSGDNTPHVARAAAAVPEAAPAPTPGVPGAPVAKPAVKPAAVTDCCICLFSVTVCQSLFIAPCSHVFHYKCIRPLLQKHHPAFSCPLCRTYADLEADVEEENETAELEAALAASAGVSSTPAQPSASAPEPELAPAATPALPAAPLVSVAEAPPEEEPSQPQAAPARQHDRNPSFTPTIALGGEDAPVIAADGVHTSQDMDMMDNERDQQEPSRRNRLKRPLGDQPNGGSPVSDPNRREGPLFPVQFSHLEEEDEDLQPAVPMDEMLWRRTNPFAHIAQLGPPRAAGQQDTWYGTSSSPIRPEDEADVTRAVPIQAPTSSGRQGNWRTSQPLDDFSPHSDGQNVQTMIGLDDSFNPTSPNFAASLGANLGQTPRNDVLFAPSAERSRGD